MARGNLASIQPYQFKKGHVSNPLGRAKLPEHLRIIKSFSPNELSRIISKYLRSTIEQLRVTEEDQSAQVIDRIIARLLISSYKKTDYNSLNFILDRCLGKMQLLPEENQENDLSKMSMQELIQVVKGLVPNVNLPMMPTESEIVIDAMKEDNESKGQEESITK